ncbi:MAG TPA: phosphotransferase, partial [Chloroflexota bacterium]|nr:phosphotransferase [Chloroflexota bacterium]
TQLEQQRSGLVQALQSDALALLEQRAELEQRIELSVPAQLASVKTRLHGDYHLGQVLLRNGDFVIIDFEGEPARTLDERRQKHSPLRDVAGMLRSFNYARHTAVGRAAERRPQELDRFAQLSAQWEKQVRTAFLRSYEEAMQSQMPADSIEPARRLLELFELEKAFYELRYELGNRPDWVGIPLRGLLALVRGK